MNATQCNRREFLRRCLVGAAGLALVGCAQPAPTSKPAEPTKAAEPATAVPEPAAVPPTPQPEPVTLTVMDNWGGSEEGTGPVLKAIFEEFMAANPGITIKEEVYADAEIPIKVETAFLAGEEPDIVLQNLMRSSYTWTENGLAIPVNDLLSECGLDDTFLPAALAQWTDEQGRLRAFPLEAFTWPMWYNTKVLEASGVEIPKTIEELLAATPKIRSAGFQPILTGGMDWVGYAQAGMIIQTMIDPKLGVPLFEHGGFEEDAAALAGWEVFTQLRDAKVFADDTPGLEEASVFAAYYAGKAAMVHGGSWSYNQCPLEMAPDVILGGFPLPAGSPHAHPIVLSGFTAKGVWVTRNGAKKLDAVRKFVQFFYQGAVMARFAEEASMPLPIKNPPVDASKLHPLLVQSLNFSEDAVTLVPVLLDRVPQGVREPLMNTCKEAYATNLTAQDIVARVDEAFEAAE